MAELNQIGIYWGSNKILCVGSDQGKTTQLFNIPYDPGDENLGPGAGFKDSGNVLAEHIQTALKQKRIKAKDFNLALPTKEIIFRSFVIPAMPPNEVAGAVVFEAGKYIPFTLEELKYAFHPIPYDENGVRKLRIIFVAIRKDTLEEYKNVLSKAGLNINVIEPAQLSLARTLCMYSLLPEKEVVAIVEYDTDYGKITVVADKIPVFVREFQLKANPDIAADAAVETDLATKLINEVKISLDYFARQDRTLKTSSLILISEEIANELKERIQSDLGIDVSTLSSKQILGHQKANDINYLNAFGASVVGGVNFETSLNFSENRKKIFQSQSASPKKSSIDIKQFIPVGVICVAMMAVAFYFTNKSVAGSQTKVDQITTELAEYADMDTSTIEMLNAKIRKKQKAYDEVRIGSHISKYLSTIPKLLPEGSWLEKMEVTYNESGFKDKPVIKMNGYVYHENVNEQFRLVYRLQQNLKEDDILVEVFKNIDLQTTESKRLGETDVTFFRIKCD